MGLDFLELKAKAARLREMAERMESFAKRREDLDREEKELERLLEPSNSELPLDAAKEPKTQLERLAKILSDHPKIKREDAYELLKATGASPANIAQFSALLSRGKAKHLFTVDGEYRWSVKK